MSAFPDEVDDRPTLFPSLQVIETEIGQFTSSKTATEQNGNDRSVSLSLESFGIGRLPQIASFLRGQPIPQTNTQFLHALYASNTGCEFWAE